MGKATSTVTVKWIDGNMMTGMDSNHVPIVIGGFTGAVKWQGVKPSDLLLLAAASCSTSDVATILIKQREPLEKLEVICTGEQETEPPYQFVTLHLHYMIHGQINPEKLARAIYLSEEKYCSVLATIRSSVTLSSDYEIV
jgi:putative redox protein